MALTINITNKIYNGIRTLDQKFQLITLNGLNQKRYRNYVPPPRLRNPTWFTRKVRAPISDSLSIENREFLKEVVQDKIIESNLNSQSKELITTAVPWTERIQRTGLIAKKIGIYPLWLNTGKKVMTTLLQVVDNHVVKYHPPESYNIVQKLRPRVYNKKGVLLIGAEISDPSNFTKEYCGLFKESGVVPTQWLGRFFVSPEAALPLGTTLTVKHFQVGNYVDIRGKTIDRGFQGVMKRHGFKGMPASHGVTKTHRRPGNIGGGGEKGRVWPGTKLPGHMGNRYRVARGLKILRINYKYNVMWVIGQAIPGETNSMVYVFDTKLPLRRPQNELPVPTLFATENGELPEEVYDKSIHSFNEPTIIYEEKK